MGLVHCPVCWLTFQLSPVQMDGSVELGGWLHTYVPVQRRVLTVQVLPGLGIEQPH